MSPELASDPAADPAVDPVVEGEDAPVAATPSRPRSSPFRRRVARVPMDADAAARQGHAAMLAFEKLGDGAAVRDFLNTPHEALGARPIDLAIADADGLARVEAVIAGLAPSPAREPA